MDADRFRSGAQLSRAFYDDVVSSLLGGVPHGAALLGWGSDVLGYDTERSTDHGWGPRVVVWLEGDADPRGVSAALDRALPATYDGWPVRFGWDEVVPRHHVEVVRLGGWLQTYLGVDASQGMQRMDWLLTAQQRLLGVLTGPVFCDPSGALDRVRSSLAWYPDQTWRWMMACQWHRLAQEEAFVARQVEVGDPLGAASTRARLVRDLMRLALWQSRCYAPYQKWLGTAFARLEPDDGLPALLASIPSQPVSPAGSGSPAQAMVVLAERHEALGLTDHVSTALRAYHSRPYEVLMADRFTQALLETVTDPALRALPLIGTIDQFVDSTDVLEDPARCRALAQVYEPV